MNSWAGSLALESPSISLNLRLQDDSPALSGAPLWVSQIGWEILASSLLYLVQNSKLSLYTDRVLGRSPNPTEQLRHSPVPRLSSILTPALPFSSLLTSDTDSSPWTLQNGSLWLGCCALLQDSNLVLLPLGNPDSFPPPAER